MKTLLFLVALGTVIVVTQGCAHRNPDTADAKVVITIEGESRHVGRVLATLPHRSGASEPPERESGTVAGDASANDDGDDGNWDDDNGDDDDSSWDDDGSEEEDDGQCDGLRGGRGRHHARWD